MTVIAARPQDAVTIAPLLRTQDYNEVIAATGHTPETLLPLCLDYGRTWAAFPDASCEIPVLLFGVTANGAPWLLATEEIGNHTVYFLRHCREWVDEMHRDHDTLFNYTDARNHLHHRWLKWAGFEILRTPLEHGPYHKHFYFFTKTKDN